MKDIVAPCTSVPAATPQACLWSPLHPWSVKQVNASKMSPSSSPDPLTSSHGVSTGAHPPSPLQQPPGLQSKDADDVELFHSPTRQPQLAQHHPKPPNNRTPQASNPDTQTTA